MSVFALTVTQSETIGGLPGWRTATRYAEPNMRLSGVWKFPSLSVRGGSPLNRTRYGGSSPPLPRDQISSG